MKAGEKIESATMLYIFEMFGKSVTQMLQQSVSQQVEIDELRGQIRSLQGQVTHITTSIDEIEDRVFIKMQAARPVIYTRDGVPLDDALDMIQSRLQTIGEKSQAHDELLTRMDDE